MIRAIVIVGLVAKNVEFLGCGLALRRFREDLSLEQAGAFCFNLGAAFDSRHCLLALRSLVPAESRHLDVDSRVSSQFQS